MQEFNVLREKNVLVFNFVLLKYILLPRHFNVMSFM